MKLSEALRAGAAKLDRQVIVSTLLRMGDGSLCGCALGAIAVGAGFMEQDSPPEVPDLSSRALYFVERMFPQLAVNELDHFTADESSLIGQIVTRNDSNRQTFDMIANWLERIGE